MKINNDKILSDLKQVNFKIDNISDIVRELKAENESLRRENVQLKQQIADLQINIDRINGNIKRKNLRVQGIPGDEYDSRFATEQKARQFLEKDLKFDQASTIKIDDARRVKSSYPTKPTILLTFSNSGDISTIMQKAKENLQGNSGVYVQYDYTDRVRRHRKILGERMPIERQQGNYSSVRHDKLIINDGIYKYIDNTQSNVYIGRRQSYGSRQPNNSADQNEHHPIMDNQSQQSLSDTNEPDVDRMLSDT
ncbi:hypothetical protein DPMN_039250 [Dreissena polymorpha]|uniref:Uncharacterized protein n=1 Tax=Dreissena polymorpha TaxID=45954 RepID=A0A9D4RNZ8_DREPO|nr:hypothetical protein DPMN_039250 [Dreissena polymorpha]